MPEPTDTDTSSTGPVSTQRTLLKPVLTYPKGTPRSSTWAETCNIHPDKTELAYALVQSESDIDSLTASEIELLKRYTGDDYSMFNTAYANGLETPVHASERKILNSFLARETQEGRPPVFRGVRSSHPMFDTYNNNIELWVQENLTPGSVYSSPDFMSTSISSEIAKSYAGVGIAKHDCLIFEIQTSYGICVESITQYAGEMEVVLPMNHAFVVDSVREVGVTERNQRVFVARLSDHIIAL